MIIYEQFIFIILNFTFYKKNNVKNYSLFFISSYHLACIYKQKLFMKKIYEHILYIILYMYIYIYIYIYMKNFIYIYIT